MFKEILVAMLALVAVDASHAGTRYQSGQLLALAEDGGAGSNDGGGDGGPENGGNDSGDPPTLA